MVRIKGDDMREYRMYSVLILQIFHCVYNRLHAVIYYHLQAEYCKYFMVFATLYRVNICTSWTR